MKTWKQRVRHSLWRPHISSEARRDRDYRQGPAERGIWSPRQCSAWKSCLTNISQRYGTPLPLLWNVRLWHLWSTLLLLKWQPGSPKCHQRSSPQLTAQVCGFLTLFSKLCGLLQPTSQGSFLLCKTQREEGKKAGKEKLRFHYSMLAG